MWWCLMFPWTQDTCMCVYTTLTSNRKVLTCRPQQLVRQVGQSRVGHWLSLGSAAIEAVNLLYVGSWSRLHAPDLEILPSRPEKAGLQIITIGSQEISKCIEMLLEWELNTVHIFCIDVIDDYRSHPLLCLLLFRVLSCFAQKVSHRHHLGSTNQKISMRDYKHIINTSAA